MSVQYNLPKKVFKKLGGWNLNEHTIFEGAVHILRIPWAGGGGGRKTYTVRPKAFLKKVNVGFSRERRL